MKNVLASLIFVFFLGPILPATAQQANPPFFSEIQAFRKADSLNPPPQNAVVFTGSSSFRLWPDLPSYFPQHTVLNRGFGGSAFPDLFRYEDDVIFKYRPKQVVIYCGDNDLAASDTVSSQLVVERFQKLFGDIRSALPKTSVVFVSIKPSPSRWHLKEKAMQANAAIKNFLAKKKNTAFVNVWDPMLDEAGNPQADLFVQDRLHMNAKGYAIWQKLIERVLKK